MLLEGFVRTQTYPLLSSRHILLWRDMESSDLMDVVTANRSRKNRQSNYIIIIIIIKFSFHPLKITNN
jgi:hypothetical protein